MLNAVCHRDYRLQGSTFIKQWPSRVEITSPGGFPPGITVANILSRQSPRNRRLAEAFGKCRLVERSGQGADLLFETAVREGKVPLDYRGSDEFQVRLTLHGRVEDEGAPRSSCAGQRRLSAQRAVPGAPEPLRPAGPEPVEGAQDRGAVAERGEDASWSLVYCVNPRRQRNSARKAGLNHAGSLGLSERPGRNLHAIALRLSRHLSSWTR